jgi:CheY-like chemotaxis protein
VLLVDDSAVLRRVAAITMQSIGAYVVDEAVDAFDALNKLAENVYDVIITDFYMPGMDGIQFVRKVRDGQNRPSVPIIMITSEEDPFVEVEAHEAGVDEFLIKPLDPTKLREALARAVGSRGRAAAETMRITAPALLDAIPYPAMVLDSAHNVVLGNQAFWHDAKAGIDDAELRCYTVMHSNGVRPGGCPLAAAVKTGEPVEVEMLEDGVHILVSVYPLEPAGEGATPLFLHITRPIA